MYCLRCGHNINENAKFCVHCGQPVTAQPPKSAPAPKSAQKGLSAAIVLLACGTALTALLLIIAVAALIFLPFFVPQTSPAVAVTDATVSDAAEPDYETVSDDASDIADASYFSAASASSVLPDEKGYNYSADNVLISNNFCWCEGASGYGEGEWIKLELPERQRLYGIVVINGYAGTEGQYDYNGKLSEILIEFSDGSSTRVSLQVPSTGLRRMAQPIVFDTPVDTEYVKITILSVSKGECADTCLTYVAPYTDQYE